MRGIRLNLTQWSLLLANTGTLLEALQRVNAGETTDVSIPLTHEAYAGVKTPYPVVNIRLWYDAGGDVMKPGRVGVTLRESEVQHLLNIRAQIDIAASCMPLEQYGTY